MSRIRKISAAAAAVAGLSLGAQSVAAQEWNMPTPYPAGNFHTQNIEAFADDVKEMTDGDLTIQVHPAGALFKHPEIKNAVRSRQAAIGEFFLSLLSNEHPVFGADSLPFLATTYDQARNLWEAQEPIITDLLAEQNLKPLYAVPWPPQGLYTQKPVDSIDDLKGVRFRTYNATLERFANLAGAAPTQVEVPDIPQAFATGRVEAMITSPSTGANSKAWDFVDHYYDIRAWVPKNIVVVNQDAFDSLPPSQQEALLDAAEAAEARGWEMSRKETEKQTQKLAENGMEVHEPSDQLVQDFQMIGATMAEDWLKDAGKLGETLLNDYSM